MSRRRGERRGPIIAPRFYIITRNWRILSLSLPVPVLSRFIFRFVSIKRAGEFRENFREGKNLLPRTEEERERERIDKGTKEKREGETIVIFEQRCLEFIIYNFSLFRLGQRCRWGERDN